MPDIPTWTSRVPNALQILRVSNDPWVDRGTVETLLGIKRRRAQQILDLAGCKTVGASHMAARGDLIFYLEHVAGDSGEVKRQKKIAAHLTAAREEQIRKPRLLVDLDRDELRRLRDQAFDSLPPGITLEPGRITVEFSEPVEALHMFVALVTAIARDQNRFFELVEKKGTAA